MAIVILVGGDDLPEIISDEEVDVLIHDIDTGESYEMEARLDPDWVDEAWDEYESH